MRKRVVRGLAGLVATLAMCVCMPLFSAESSENVVEAFFFAHSGTTAEQARSYRIAETARGRIIRIELSYACYIVLPVTDDDINAFSALLDALKLSDWNGFDETDTDVLDGESFSLDVEFSDGGVIAACGSNCFPTDYAEAAARIETFFQELMESYDIDIEQIIL